MRPTDLALLRTPGVPTVSPDGRIAVVAVARPELEADDYRSQLWAVPTDASAPARPLTAGHRDSAPAFSPDGRWLAYLSAAPGGRPQVWLLPTAGGAPRRLTDHHLGAGAPVWSPDSRRLAYTARIPEPGRYGTVDGIGPGEEPPRLITTLKYRQDDVGFLADRRSQVFVLDLPEDFDDDTTPAPEPVQVTTGDADCADVTWRPDGAELAFVSARHPRADRDLVRDVYAVRADGSGLRKVTGSRGDCAFPAYDTTGQIYVTAVPDLGPDGLDFVARQAVPCRVDAAGGGLVPLLDPERDHRGDETPATVLVDGAVLVGVQRRGAVELLRVPLDGAAPEPLVDGPFTVRGFAAAGGVVVAVVAHDRSAGELIAITPGRRRLLTAFGHRLGAAGRAQRMQQRTETAALRPPAGGAGPKPRYAGPSCSRRRRLPGTRLGHGAARPGAAPGPAHHPRRPVHAVRLAPVRRDADLRVRRVRGRAVQPPRLLRLWRRARPRHPGGMGERGRRGRAGVPRRGAGRPGAGRRPGRNHGRLVRRLPDRAADRPHPAVRRRDHRAGVPRPGELRGFLGHRVVLPRPVPRHRSGADRRPGRDDVRLGDHHADDGHPLRGGLALPGGAGCPALRRAQAPRRPDRAAAVPGGGARAVPLRPARHRLARLEHVL